MLFSLVMFVIVVFKGVFNIICYINDYFNAYTAFILLILEHYAKILLRYYAYLLLIKKVFLPFYSWNVMKLQGT
jgi:hypothetical protein